MPYCLKPICQFFLKIHTYVCLQFFRCLINMDCSFKANTCCTHLLASSQAPFPPLLPAPNSQSISGSFRQIIVMIKKVWWYICFFGGRGQFPDVLSDNRARGVGLLQLFPINSSSNKVSGWLSTRDLWNALMLPHFKSLHKQPGNELNKFCWRRKKEKKKKRPCIHYRKSRLLFCN